RAPYGRARRAKTALTAPRPAAERAPTTAGSPSGCIANEASLSAAVGLQRSMRQPIRTALGVILVVLFGLNQETIGKTIGPSCAVGVTGTAAIMEARGWLGFQACDAVAAQNPIPMYRYTGEIRTPVV